MVVDFIKQYITLAQYNISDILPLTKSPSRIPFYIEEKLFPDDDIVDVKKYIVKINSIRYKIFERDLSCYGCGIIGTFFLLQQHKKMNSKTKDNVAHLNLYAEDSLKTNGGNFILMTIDHFLPKSKGGLDSLENLKTMCAICNHNKADSIID